MWFGPWAVALVLVSRPSAACGGGGVTTSVESGVVADTQRVVLALHDEGTTEVRTEIVAQIGVPAAGADYGVLIPVPGTPTVDNSPISTDDLDELDRATAPTLIIQQPDTSDDSGGGCSCGSDTKGDDDSGSGTLVASDNVSVSAPVNVGPATVVVLAADDPSALGDWLDENGFAIPSDQQSLVDVYVENGYQFIALKRSDDAAPDGPTSIGLHYTLEGDHRQLSLAFARLGAAPHVAFTVFVASQHLVAPSDGFETLTLNHLDAGVLRTKGYSAAVGAAVAQAGAHAFVVESTLGPPISADVSREFRELLGINASPYNSLTRMSTVVAADALDADVRVDAAGKHVESKRTFYLSQGARLPLPRESSAGVLALVLLSRSIRRRMRPT